MHVSVMILGIALPTKNLAESMHLAEACACGSHDAYTGTQVNMTVTIQAVAQATTKAPRKRATKTNRLSGNIEA